MSCPCSTKYKEIINSRGIGGHQSHKMGKDEWLTPPEILKALGPFDLDPCSPVNRPWPTAREHYTVHDNGLKLPWTGRVFCNPPYGRETGRWLARCAEHGNAIALIFARTETSDWVEHVWNSASAVLFIFGRLSFHHVDGSRSISNSGGPSALIAYGKGNVETLRACRIAGCVVCADFWRVPNAHQPN